MNARNREMQRKWKITFALSAIVIFLSSLDRKIDEYVSTSPLDVMLEELIPKTLLQVGARQIATANLKLVFFGGKVTSFSFSCSDQ